MSKAQHFGLCLTHSCQFFAKNSGLHISLATMSILMAACDSSSHNVTSTLTPTISCNGLAAQLSLPNTAIESVTLDVGGQIDSDYPNAGPKPENCVVKGTIGAYASAYTDPDTGSNQFGIGFEMRLPTQWNGRFFYQAGGGTNGFIDDPVGKIPGQQATLVGVSPQTPALWRGYAVVSSDSGHHSGDTRDANVLAGFGVDPVARVNFGYASIGQVTPIAKKIIQQYYATEPRHSYLLGCSKGGQEAMQASQKYGDQFDGIVAGDPGYHLPHAAINDAWTAQALAAVVQADDPSSIDTDGNPLLYKAFSSSDLELVRHGVLDACDTLDGVADGMIFNTGACTGKFNPATLQCSGVKTNSCLTVAQVTALDKIFAGAKASNNTALYSSFPYDTGLGGFNGWVLWRLGYLTGSNSALSVTLVKGSSGYIFSTPPNPAFDIFNVNIDQFAQSVHATSGDYNVAAVDFMEPVSVDLDAFKQRGGKIIYFHGGSDPIFSMNDTIDYYSNLTSAYGETTPNFARLFLVPGMNHCFGGPYTTDYFASLDAVVDWVENGKAPDAITAQVGDAAGSLLPAGTTRPLCAYPKYARYSGSGDVNNAANYSCSNP
jgi:hypothetical protein